MNYASVLFSEIFEEFDKAKNREERVAILQKYGRNVWFKEFLNYAFNPKIHFDISQIPNYKPAVEPAGVCYSNLSNEMRRLYIFIAGHPKRTVKLDAKKEARILHALLSSVHKEEAALLVKCFRKDLGVRYLTARLVKEAFPNLPFDLPGDDRKEEVITTKPVKMIDKPSSPPKVTVVTTGATVKV
jgi:hypothetical protein